MIGEATEARMVTYERRALVVGISLFGLSVLGAVLDADQFFRSYLVGYLFWSGLALGCLALLLLHHLVGGEWGFVSRRVLEAATRTLPVIAVLFLPLALGLGSLYEWSIAGRVAEDELLQHKSAYLNVPFFLARAVVYFAVWLVLAHRVNKYSREQDKGERTWVGRLQLTGGVGLLLYGLTVTFASVDWVMSLDPDWYSTIFGLLFMVGQVLSALALVVVVLHGLSGEPLLARRLGRSQFHDLGNLMLAFVMLWAYHAFSQYLLIWAGNLPDEIPYYLTRLHGSWKWFGPFLVVFHFAVPFLLLLSRATKRSAEALVKVAVAVLLVRAIDEFWLVAPVFSESLRVHWLDGTVFFGIGGIWLAFFLRQIRALPLLPLHDPRFALERAAPDGMEAMEHGTS